MSTKPYFVISLDFELYWGMFDKVTLQEYGKNIAGVHTVLPKLLKLFEENDIHCTWATVGMLMLENKKELLTFLPKTKLRPKYRDPELSSYHHIDTTHIGETVSIDPYHYGAALVQKIVATKNQELASHTFSHYYCLDGQENSVAVFRADCEAFAKVAERFGAPIKSIVFPRNQTTKEALQVCREFGLEIYRGTPEHFLYTGKNEKQQTSLWLRALRLVDTYFNLTGHHTFTFSTVNSTKSSGLKNVPGSRFLRPYSHTLKILEPIKLRRIKESMTYAAKHNQIFHLWWHPHNFGINQEENLNNLKILIDHYKYLQKTYGMQSANMQEVAKLGNESPV